MFESHTSSTSSSAPNRLKSLWTRATNRLSVKLVAPMAIIILLITAGVGLFVESSVRQAIKANAEAQTKTQVADIARNLETSNRLVLDQVKAAMRVLQREARAEGAPTLGAAAVQVGPETVWDLKLGNASQANNFEVVDEVANLMGGTATLFVKNSDDFVRVSTNIKKDDGARAVGTKLGAEDKAAAQLRQGKPFYGLVEIFGKPYITGYEPLLNDGGEVIGAWHVGYPVQALTNVSATIENAKVLDRGYFALFDDAGELVFKSKSADADFVRKLADFKNGKVAGGSMVAKMNQLAQARDMADWNYTKQTFEPWNYTIVSAYSNSDLGLTAPISRVRWYIFLGGLFIAALLCGICLLVARRITEPLNQAVEVANRLSTGDLSVDLSIPRSGDETGQLLVAMENMTRYLNEMADTSDEIASGNLSVQVVSRSTDDRFGSSFERMTDYLRSMARISDEIAAGNLDTRVAPRSEQDRFGTAFKNMLDNTLGLVQSREERDSIQKSVMKLLEEVADVANGDLTVEAEVTADATGAIADAFNFMIAELRQIITNVKQATLQVSSSASEIQSTTEHLAEGSEAQARQIVETSKSIEDMVSSIQKVSENAALSAGVADQALANAQQGAQAVQNNINAMGKIRDQVQETSKRIKRLGERSQEIGEITGVIDDLADRTSLLALNASIQASMAGEAGRGFAVVAEEVERLAERSADATKQIATLIKTIQSETNEAVAAMEDTTREVVDGSSLANEAGQALSEIEIVSHRLANLIGSISDASQQQARGSEAIAHSISGISNVTQQVATSTKQAADSVRGLVSLADNLRGSVVTFKLPEQVVELDLPEAIQESPAFFPDHLDIIGDDPSDTYNEHPRDDNGTVIEHHNDDAGLDDFDSIAHPDGVVLSNN